MCGLEEDEERMFELVVQGCCLNLSVVCRVVLSRFVVYYCHDVVRFQSCFICHESGDRVSRATCLSVFICHESGDHVKQSNMFIGYCLSVTFIGYIRF